ncbi:MAG: N-acetylmuramoyl-L-alanine amidase [Holdemanella sp.]|nr:N-acetylmuramoyl-L-alanine amidase [Holdemanella sp.]
MIIFILCVAILSVSIFLIASRPTDIDKINMDYGEVLDVELLKSNATAKFKDTYELKDYTIYGENLMLYENMYSAENTDSLQGKNVVVRNIETMEELNFTFSGGVDSGIDLNALSEGMYEVYVYDHYVKKRVFFTDEVNTEEFTTMRRNGKVKSISIHASSTYLSEIGIDYKKNYVFITVFENTPIASNVDVVLDPRGLINNPETGETDYGLSNDTMSEAKESYEFALLVKEELEKMGLKVLINREKDQSLSYYGKKGRVGVGYESNALLFISLGMTADATISRPYIVTSPYTVGLLANEIAYTMKDNGLELNAVSTADMLQVGVRFDKLMQDEFGYYYEFEYYPQLRESGGKSTFAGQYDVSGENERYANSYGMYAIDFVFANMGSEESLKYYKDHKITLAIQLAKGISEYYHIESNEE